jgi:hypothetical protein
MAVLFLKGVTSMNRKQMIVLIAGSIALIVVLLTAPKVYILPSRSSDDARHLVRYNSPPRGYYNAKPTIDLAPTLVRISIVAIVGAVAWYILKDKR